MKFIKAALFLFFLLPFLHSCGKSDSSENPSESPVPETQNIDPLKSVELVSPSGKVISADLAYTPEDQQQGLQNVQPEEFGENDGMLFFYLRDAERTFWMPNTYFDLDLVYLDEDLRVTEIVQDLPHHTGDRSEEVPRAPAIFSRYVLEMKSSSEISNGLRVGDQLQWNSPLTLPQTESEIRQRL